MGRYGRSRKGHRSQPRDGGRNRVRSCIVAQRQPGRSATIGVSGAGRCRERPPTSGDRKGDLSTFERFAVLILDRDDERRGQDGAGRSFLRVAG